MPKNWSDFYTYNLQDRNVKFISDLGREMFQYSNNIEDNFIIHTGGTYKNYFVSFEVNGILTANLYFSYYAQLIYYRKDNLDWENTQLYVGTSFRVYVYHFKTILCIFC